MRNIYTIFALLSLALCPSLSAKAATETKLVVKMMTGDSVAYRLVDKPTVRFTNEKIEIESKSFSKSINDILSLKFIPHEVPESSSGSVTPATNIPDGIDYVPKTPSYDQTPKNEPFPVDPIDIGLTVISLSQTLFDYTGSEIKPTVTVTYVNTLLEEGTDYTLTYSDNIKPGEASVTITGIGNYTGSTIAKFVITIQPAFAVTINAHDVTPQLTMEYDVTSADYYTSSGTVSLSNYYALPGETVTVWLIPANGYWTSKDSSNVQLNVNDVTDLSQMSSYTYTVPASGKVEMNINFYKCTEITRDMITLDAESYVYEGTPIVPIVTLKNDTTILKVGEDYTLTIDNNDEPGTATLRLIGINRYMGSVDTTFVIKPQIIDLSSEDITVSFQEPLYTIVGTPVTPEVTVKHGDTVLVENTDYTIICTNNDAPGNGKLTITGIGNYTGTIDTTFVIEPLIYDLVTTVTLTMDEVSFTYTGKPIAPVYQVKHGEKELVEGTDYTATLTDNTNSGTAHLTITGTDKVYSGTIDTTFVITNAMLTVKADTLTKVYREENPELTIASMEGFVNNEDVSVISSLPTGTTTCEIDSPVGEYAITFSGGEAQNYDFTYIDATLTVTPRSITEAIVMLTPDSVAYSGQPVLPEVLVQCGNTTLAETIDYEVSATNNTEPGIAQLIIKAKESGNYEGQIDTTFVIYLKPTVEVVINDSVISKPTLYDDNVADFVTRHGTVSVDDYYALPGTKVTLTVSPKSTWLLLSPDSVEVSVPIKVMPHQSSYVATYIVPEEGIVTVKVHFSVDSVALGVRDQYAGDLRFEIVDGQTVRVLDAREAAPVSVFDARGQQVAAEVVRSEREIIVRLSRQPQGLYIIKVNNNTFKVYRK